MPTGRLPSTRVSLTLALQPRLGEPHYVRLLQPIHYYGAQSRPQTKQTEQTQQRQLTLTP